MFYGYADVTIQSDLAIDDLAQEVARALQTLPLHVDTSGRYEGGIVYATVCFGLDVELAADPAPRRTYHLTVNSNVDMVDFDGSEREIDCEAYVLALLKRAGIGAASRDPTLLYGDAP